MKPERVTTKKIRVGNLFIGGGERIKVQSMTNAPTSDFNAVLEQILSLEEAGCDIVRFTVPDMDAVRNISRLKEKTHIPLVADIHFDHKLALESAEAGIDKIRINPGNIGSAEKVRAVAAVCRRKGIPIRIGVNSGSLEKSFLAKFGGVSAIALAESALHEIELLEKADFEDIIVSVKSSSVNEMIRANRILSSRTRYPLHLGVTEAGTTITGLVKSSVGIGSLLSEGIGDTIRVSLTCRDLREEIHAANRILSACEITEDGVHVISCPTCGRTKIGIVHIANALEERLEKEKIQTSRPIRVAVMGCAVNGPGEAREADIGIAGGRGEALLFKKGEIIKKIPENEILDVLLSEIRLLAGENK